MRGISMNFNKLFLAFVVTFAAVNALEGRCSGGSCRANFGSVIAKPVVKTVKAVTKPVRFAVKTVGGCASGRCRA